MAHKLEIELDRNRGVGKVVLDGQPLLCRAFRIEAEAAGPQVATLTVYADVKFSGTFTEQIRLAAGEGPKPVPHDTDDTDETAAAAIKAVVGEGS